MAQVTNDPNVNGYSIDDLNEIADFIRSKIAIKPVVGIICGSGLAPLADTLEDPVFIGYDEIPKFPVSTVQGHSATLAAGTLSKVPVLCFKGRFHYYEGYPLWMCALPVRVMKLLGCTHLIVTNAAGGINKDCKIGNLMIIKDHVNFLGLAGNNPLRGPNEDALGPRFPGMNKAYDKELRIKSFEIAKDMGIDNIVFEGVYACVGGPTYETIAELNLMQTCGIDAVGMSTAPEVVAAKHCNLTVFAFSLISNECVLDYESDKVPNHLEVLEATKAMESVVQDFVKKLVEYIGASTCSCKTGPKEDCQ